ncbi:MAG: preprotein translocase subunit SecA [Acidobacteriota bacterium]|nr:MAG: preprotein translocase subunit SecA [Acidobacteriota bacterium]
MIEKVLGKVFGTKNERELKRMRPVVAAINEREAAVRALSDEQLRGKTAEFRAQLEAGASPDDLLVDAFAVAREAGRRALNMRHFDVQLIGGVVLHQGKIAEMRTGEGKTLVATLPGYLRGLTGRGVHVVTVNDYLARRDAEWMGQIYKFLGLSVGCIQHDLDEWQRREAYQADITYATNNEVGFDYLRDNMKFSRTGMVQQKGHHFAIVDEVDSILIDEARTPLIISGPSEGDTSVYYDVDRIVPSLKQGAVIAGEAGRDEREELEASGDYIIDEKSRNVVMTEQGVAHAEKLLHVANLYDPSNIEKLHALTQALRAHTLYKRDVDYLVESGEVVIIDEFTGRKMPGRRWSDGLHQAVEAKEGVQIRSENQTLATITFQNLFRMYETLSGMTGTAETEAAEFAEIYKLDVVVIPTNMPMVREDRADVILKSARAKNEAVVEEIAECHQRRQPVLVGTTSIENSEGLSKLLRKRGVPHEVLNAKQHQREAEIVAQAGRLGSITIATNMAGRGTDIILGGNPEALARRLLVERESKKWDEAEPSERERALEQARETCSHEHREVVELGGLHIIGTERHEARRIDNQLRGRAGRQGDPGSSRFYLSLEDDLMRRFAGWLMEKALDQADDMPIESKVVSRAIERAQKQVEAQNFSIRKRLLEYDDVQNLQRKEVYTLRREILDGADPREYVLGKAEELLDFLIDEYIPEDQREEVHLDELEAQVLHYFGFSAAKEGIELSTDRSAVKQHLVEHIHRRYEAKEERVSAEEMRQHETNVILQIIDSQWKDHLLALDHLKEGISLRAYAQRDPLVEYKRESFELFAAMKERVENEIVRYLMLLEPMTEEERREQLERRRRQQEMIFRAASAAKEGEQVVKTVRREGKRIGRNDPCPCGSGKKYKKCCGAATAAKR